MGRVLVLLALVLTVFASLPAEASNPFRPQGSQAETAAEAPAPPGAFKRFWGKVMRWQSDVARRISRHMRAIRDGDSPAAFWIALGFSFLYGALHTIGPGHGKMVTASYFLGREARVWQPFAMGAQIALTHVAAAIVLVWLADVTIRHLLGGVPAEIAAVRQVSYGAILAVGLFMLWRALGRARHVHHHGHDHGHAHGCATCTPAMDGRQQGLLALLAGMVPCTGAVLVMLYALANDILFAGIAMVLAISAGMFGTISAIGLFALFARRAALGRMERARGPGRRAMVLEMAGAVFICLIGGMLLATTL